MILEPPPTNLLEKTDTTTTDMTDIVLPATKTGTEITAGTEIVVTETTGIAGMITGIRGGGTTTTGGIGNEETDDHATRIDGAVAGAKIFTEVDLMAAITMNTEEEEELDVDEIDIVERNLANEGRLLLQMLSPCLSESERLLDGT